MIVLPCLCPMKIKILMIKGKIISRVKFWGRQEEMNPSVLIEELAFIRSVSYS